MIKVILIAFVGMVSGLFTCRIFADNTNIDQLFSQPRIVLSNQWNYPNRATSFEFTLNNVWASYSNAITNIPATNIALRKSAEGIALAEYGWFLRDFKSGEPAVSYKLLTNAYALSDTDFRILVRYAWRILDDIRKMPTNKVSHASDLLRFGGRMASDATRRNPECVASWYVLGMYQQLNHVQNEKNPAMAEFVKIVNKGKIDPDSIAMFRYNEIYIINECKMWDKIQRNGR